MMRMPTAPGVLFQSAMTSATAGSSGVDRLDDSEPAGMGPRLGTAVEAGCKNVQNGIVEKYIPEGKGSRHAL